MSADIPFSMQNQVKTRKKKCPQMSDFPRKIKYRAKKIFRCFCKRVGLINSGVARNFKREGGYNFHTFCKRIYFSAKQS